MSSQTRLAARRVAAHEAGLRRIEQAGGKMISVPQLFCELQRDWARKETVPGFMSLFIETGGTAGIQFSYDKSGVKSDARRNDRATDRSWQMSELFMVVSSREEGKRGRPAA